MTVSVVVDQYATELGVSHQQALAHLMLWAVQGQACPFLLVYHPSVERETPVAQRPLREGPPELPWSCPACGEVVTEGTALMYDFLFEVTPIEIELWCGECDRTYTFEATRPVGKGRCPCCGTENDYWLEKQELLATNYHE